MNQLGRVLDAIDPQEVVDLALALGQIDSPSGHEHAVGEYLMQWCAQAGLAPRPMSAFPGLAPNVVARLPGLGTGPSLLFNSHQDTVVRSGDDTYYREPDHPELHTAWRSDDQLVGVGLVNDKGPMACWLVAAAAIRRSGVRLAGDLVLTMVTGEIGHEPVDEWAHPPYHGKDHGSRFVATHGAVADYALVAETTAFTPIWVEPGKAYFKVLVRGRDRGVYTPYLRRPYPPGEHPNAVVRASLLIPALEEWAYEYEQRTRRVYPGGEVVPKVNLGAIRAGHPTQPILSPASCALYLDVRLPPGDHPGEVQAQLRKLVTQVGLDAEVECYLFRRGYQAQGAEPLVAALREASDAELADTRPPAPGPEPSSMWRDVNVWNELGIPAVTFGPGTGTGGGNAAIAVADLVACARVYARTALAVSGPAR